MKLLQPDPIHHTLSPDWKYVQSGKTDIRRTFKRWRDRIAAEEKVKPNKIRELKRANK